MERPGETQRPTEAQSHDMPMQIHLRDYFAIIRKRKWPVLGLFVSAILATALNVSMQPRIYESTVSLMIEPTGPNVMSKAVEEVYAPIDVNIDYYKTQYEILKSYKILRETVSRLNLKEHPEYLPQPAGPVASWFTEVRNNVLSVFKTIMLQTPAGSPGKHAESEIERQLVNAFQGHVSVKPLLNSRIVRVAVESTDPQLAADAANTMASVYITRSLDMKISASQEASKWIAERVEELRGKVEMSERALQEFTSRYGLVNVDAIQSLRSQEIKASQKVAELSEKYGPKYPAMIEAVSELNEVQAKINNEIRKMSAVKGEYDVAVARDRMIRGALNNQNNQKNDVMMATAEHEVQYGILTREVQSNRQLYEMFLKRLKETDIATDIRTSNIFVVDPAIVSMMPVRPNKKQAVLLAGLFGLLIGVAVAFFLDYMDSSIKTPDDVTQYLPGVAFLGFLPKFKTAKDNKRGVDLAMHAAPQSIFAENLRSIRTSLFLSAADKPPRSILVTSAQEDEGKSTLSVNLAIAIGQLGHPTVLIDGDLRRPRLHKLFNLDVKKGLSHYLAGEADLHEILLDTPIPKLRIIPSGAVPPNPCELLQSKQMHALLARFKKEGTYVIVDSSPILAVSDPIVLGNRVDGVILVVWAGNSSRNAAQLAVKLMSEGKVKLCGIVLQRLLRAEMSGAYYKYYRTKYYGPNPAKALTHKT